METDDLYINGAGGAVTLVCRHCGVSLQTINAVDMTVSELVDECTEIIHECGV